MALRIEKNNNRKRVLTECSQDWYEEIPDILKSIDYIGEATFANSDLTEIEIPRGIENIGFAAFSNSKKLKNVTINAPIKTLPRECFKGCEQLTTIILPKGLDFIGENAFNGCKNLETIIIPNTVKYIGNTAFYGTKIKTLRIPKYCNVENQSTNKIEIARNNFTKKDLIKRMISEYEVTAARNGMNADIDRKVLSLLRESIANVADANDISLVK